MSYIRFGEELSWFEGTSTLYAYGTVDPRQNNKAYLYDGIASLHEPPEQWIELLGRIVYTQTKDPDYTDKIVKKLSKAFGATDKLRDEFLHPYPGREGDKTRQEKDPYYYYKDDD